MHPFSRSARPACYLQDFYVDRSARGKGIGRALLAHLRDLGARNGWLKVYWLTQVDNPAARRLYDTFGSVSPLIRYDMPVNSYDM